MNSASVLRKSEIREDKLTTHAPFCGTTMGQLNLELEIFIDYRVVKSRRTPLTLVLSKADIDIEAEARRAVLFIPT